MVFKSKVKEELLTEMQKFIFWYYQNRLAFPSNNSKRFIRLTKRTNLKFKHTENHYIVMDLVDNADYPLFELTFSFTELNGNDVVEIGYYAKGETDLETFTLDDSKGIESFLFQVINHIPSETYLKYYLNLFKYNICLWCS